MAIAVPAKVLEVTVNSAISLDVWPYDDGLGDPFWTGGPSPKSYKWQITMDVNTQSHSSHLTRVPYVYNGMDITIGDYIANSTEGIALKIIEVVSKTDSTVVCKVEDVFRYNTFRSPGASGSGIFSIPSVAIVFETNEDGMPVIDPVPPGGVSNVFGINLMSRFQNFDIQNNFKLEKPSNGFKEGQIIAVDTANNTFVLSDDNFPVVIGVVSNAGPGPHEFYIRPNNKIIEDFDSLIGEVGDILYSDDVNPGELSLTNNGKPEYIKFRNSTQSRIVGTVVNGSTAPGNQFELNNVMFTVTGAGSIPDMVSMLNLETGFTGVVASTSPAASVIMTDMMNISSTYGEPALQIGAAPPTATINGVLVTFNITTVGMATYGAPYALEEDMATAINNANIPNITATAGGNILTISNSLGGTITIVNGTPDDGGVYFAGTNSGSGCPLTVGASTGSYLKLTAIDARAINIREILGSLLEDFGIYSVENGIKAAAMIVEQGIRKGDTYVVSDIASRDNLSVLIGDMAFVLDTGQGEWALFIYNGSQWTQVSNHDSAQTDAQSISIPITFNSTDGGHLLYRVSPGSRVVSLVVSVTTPFVGGSATLNIGDSLQHDRLMSNDVIDPYSLGEYVATPSYQYSGSLETEIYAYFAKNGATTGAMTITMTYV